MVVCALSVAGSVSQQEGWVAMRKVLYHKGIQKGALFEKRGQLGRRSRFLSARAAESSLASQMEYNEFGFSGRSGVGAGSEQNRVRQSLLAPVMYWEQSRGELSTVCLKSFWSM
jgi:hypothetical protein